jgi:hypothetical protein
MARCPASTVGSQSPPSEKNVHLAGSVRARTAACRRTRKTGKLSASDRKRSHGNSLTFHTTPQRPVSQWNDCAFEITAIRIIVWERRVRQLPETSPVRRKRQVGPPLKHPKLSAEAARPCPVPAAHSTLASKHYKPNTRRRRCSSHATELHAGNHTARM